MRGGWEGVDEVPAPPPDFATLYYLQEGLRSSTTDLIFTNQEEGGEDI